MPKRKKTPSPPKEAAPQKRRATRKDVAKAAGVSLTTVTHALNPPPGAYVAKETKERVRAVARELGYRPNFVGKALVAGKTFTIGLMLPYQDALFYRLYLDIIAGMEAAMAETNYHLLLLNRAHMERTLRVQRQGRVDGIFVLQSDLSTDAIEELAESGIPVVVVNKFYENQTLLNVGCACSDHFAMTRQAVDEFVSLGCRSILEVNGYHTIDANHEMHKGFVAASEHYAEQGVIGSTLIPSGDFRAQLRRMLDSGQRWDGVLIDGIHIAESFLEVAKQTGLTPGKDFHLISSSTLTNDTTETREEVSAYVYQPRLIGQDAWQVMEQLLAGTCKTPTALVPYRHLQVQKKAAPLTSRK